MAMTDTFSDVEGQHLGVTVLPTPGCCFSSIFLASFTIFWHPAASIADTVIGKERWRTKVNN